MDAENPVVLLCVRGMQAEAAGQTDEARRLFVQAWGSAVDDYDACVAAHYLARQQSSPEGTLRWNRECLERADRVGDERVAGFYPSLHLNIAKSLAELGSEGQAREHYVRAAAHIDAVPAGGYGDWIRFAIAEGLRAGAESPTGGRGGTGGAVVATGAAGERAARPTRGRSGTGGAVVATGAAGERAAGASVDLGRSGGSGDLGAAGAVDELVAQWCARADLKALGLVLPAHLGNLGTSADRERLVLVLRMVHAGRWLPEGEQALVQRALVDLTGIGR